MAKCKENGNKFKMAVSFYTEKVLRLAILHRNWYVTDLILHDLIKSSFDTHSTNHAMTLHTVLRKQRKMI